MVELYKGRLGENLSCWRRYTSWLRSDTATHCLVSALTLRVCQSPSCVQLFETPWSVAHQVPLSMELSRQEYCCGVPFPPPTHTVYLHQFHSLYQMPIITFLLTYQMFMIMNSVWPLHYRIYLLFILGLFRKDYIQKNCALCLIFWLWNIS